MQMFETTEHRRRSIVLSLTLPENQQIALENWQFGRRSTFIFGPFKAYSQWLWLFVLGRLHPSKYGTSKVTHFLKENHLPNLPCTRESRLLLKATLLHKWGCPWTYVEPCGYRGRQGISGRCILDVIGFKPNMLPGQICRDQSAGWSLQILV